MLSGAGMGTLHTLCIPFPTGCSRSPGILEPRDSWKPGQTCFLVWTHCWNPAHTNVGGPGLGHDRCSRLCGTHLPLLEPGISDEKDLIQFPAHFHVDKSECCVGKWTAIQTYLNGFQAANFASWSSQNFFWGCSEVYNCILLKTELLPLPQSGLQDLLISEWATGPTQGKGMSRFCLLLPVQCVGLYLVLFCLYACWIWESLLWL